ncbi:hypothetical protein SAMN04488074_12373 [Lentzea albidocapillata subsp. violacea]|uniref:Uncharacterized protein n=1 Tax=Lentzea albidocapillata subsp. violacea TaxID=128104 RepID=A0A1G9U6Y4_9PSEU|nr:hypothetical protein [Lentzea albidocapillata]SDM55737.1 hypothetical protein SAMN04488074_12373 [Lentzea albidocapillata subsp. violacea]
MKTAALLVGLLLAGITGCAAAPSIRVVVEGTGTTDRLTYTFPGEEERTLRNPDLPFERMGNRKGRVVVRLEGVHGELTCKIIINGRQVRSSTSSTGAALTCDHSMAV